MNDDELSKQIRQSTCYSPSESKDLALQLLAGLLWTIPADRSTPQGRMHLAAFDLLSPLLGMGAQEVLEHCEAMYSKHGLSLVLDDGQVARPRDRGCWSIADTDGEAVLLTTDDIKRLAEAAGVIV